MGAVEGYKNEKFSAKPHYKDRTFTVLFILHLLGFIALFVVSIIRHFARDKKDTSTPGEEDDSILFGDSGRKLAIPIASLLFGLAASIVIGLFWVLLSIYSPHGLIVASLAMNVLLTLGLAIWFFYIGSLGWAVINIIFTILLVVIYISWRKAIPFSAAILTTISRLSASTLSYVWLVAFCAVLVQIVWVGIWSWTCILVLMNFKRWLSILLFVYALFSFYWTSQVILNTCLVIYGGSYSTWYFVTSNKDALSGTITVNPDDPTTIDPTPEQVSYAKAVQKLAQHPVRYACKRAFTFSFGSICFGSLVIAVIKTIRQLLRSLRNSNIGFLVFVIDCILGCIEWMVAYFNRYALVLISIYGGSYMKAAKATFKLFEKTGVQALINDSLAGTAIGIGCFFGGLVAALATGLSAHFWLKSQYGDVSTFDLVVLVLLSFWIGISILSVMLQVIDAGIATIFVCFAQEPHILQRNEPELYEKFASRSTVPVAHSV